LQVTDWQVEGEVILILFYQTDKIPSWPLFFWHNFAWYQFCSILNNVIDSFLQTNGIEGQAWGIIPAML
jgi:hypothetical protein